MSLPGAIDHAHAAATDLLESFVISQLPGLVARVQLVEYGFINRLRYLATDFQSLAQEATHAKFGVESRGCSTLLGFRVRFGSVWRRVGAGCCMCRRC